MRSWCNRDIIFSHIYTYRQALGIDIRKMLQNISLLSHGNIQVNKVIARFLHFIINRPGYNIARCKRFTLVVLVHKLFTVLTS
ncbi:hypothetical protein D3C85_1284420 [compost metagenome]